MQYTTKSGRTIETPKWDASTDRKAANSIKRLHKWLKDEALKETHNNEYLNLIISRFNPNKLTNAESDILNNILFKP
jgi:hypothetical protein